MNTSGREGADRGRGRETGDAAPPGPTPLDRWTLDRWTFRPADPDAVPVAADWPLVAVVPGSAHTDLLAHGLIPDPFVDDHEHRVAWVADVDWVYECPVDLPPRMRNCDHVDLVFDGLDTLAEIEVDGIAVGTTENMHRSYRFPVGDLLRDRPRTVTVRFRSAVIEAERRRREWGDWPSSSFERPYNYVRKMACSWGWDWGPWLTTCGLWRPARIEAWNGCRLDRVRPTPTITDDDRGHVVVELDLDGLVDDSSRVAARLLDPDRVVVAEADTRAGAGSIELEPGRVRRWHVRGRGDQPVYRLEVDLVRDGTRVDGWSASVGFRTVELDTTPDDSGSAFVLVVNDRPMFVRGVNWIPDDPLVTRVDRARYRRRLEDIAALGADLVRVWGGGIYESDDFYDICDELGLLVWQDFAFACAAYPEERLHAEVEAEATEQVIRLMPHPSLAIWNGNNENSWGAVDWGWKDRLGDRPWGDGFYRDLLPSVLARLDPARPYSIASPYSGTPDVHPNADAHGTKHIWDVWNDVDYSHYRRYVPRFASEFGWQAPASLVSLEAASTQPVALDSSVMRNRQKAPDGQLKLDRGVATHFPSPSDLDQWIWATQLIQARAVRLGVEHLRSYRGICMGAIWWQYNDCWPAISWAVVDSFERRKPAWYALRAAFADRLLTIQPRGDRLVVVAVNDGTVAWTDDIRVERVTFDGRTAGRVEHAIDLPAASTTWFELPSDLGVAADPAREVILASSTTGSAARAEWYFERDAWLDYPEPGIDISVAADVVELTATTFVRDLAVLPERLAPDAIVDDALHTLLPGESVTTTLGRYDAPLTVEAVRAALRYANDLVAGRNPNGPVDDRR